MSDLAVAIMLLHFQALVRFPIHNVKNITTNPQTYLVNRYRVRNVEEKRAINVSFSVQQESFFSIDIPVLVPTVVSSL